MIKKWSVKNFKSIREEVNIEMAPLTLFAGQNSAGKSTLIQSILLTVQTIQSNVTSRSIVLNGRIVRLGSFNDIRSNKSNIDSVSIGFELGHANYGVTVEKSKSRPSYYFGLHADEKMTSVNCTYSFSSGPSDKLDKELQLQPRLEEGTLTYKSDEDKPEFSFS